MRAYTHSAQEHLDQEPKHSIELPHLKRRTPSSQSASKEQAKSSDSAIFVIITNTLHRSRMPEHLSGRTHQSHAPRQHYLSISRAPLSRASIHSTSPEQAKTSTLSVIITNTTTASEPCVDLYRYQREQSSNRLHIHSSCSCGLPHLDYQIMGSHRKYHELRISHLPDSMRLYIKACITSGAKQ